MKFSKTKLKVFKSIRIQIRSKSWSWNRIRIIFIRTDPQHWFLSLNMKQLALLGLKWFNFFRLQVDIWRYGKYLCKTTYNVILCLNIHKMYTKLHTYNRAGMMHIIYMYMQSWDDATSTCKSLGGHLPTIASTTDNQLLANFSQVFKASKLF